jgi:hypothetical protein
MQRRDAEGLETTAIGQLVALMAAPCSKSAAAVAG